MIEMSSRENSAKNSERPTRPKISLVRAVPLPTCSRCCSPAPVSLSVPVSTPSAMPPAPPSDTAPCHRTIHSPPTHHRFSAGLFRPYPPLAHGIGQRRENLAAVLPPDAAIGDADAVGKPLAGQQVLPAALE